MSPLNALRLRQVLRYDPGNGEFTWVSGLRIGLMAGSVNAAGYVLIGVDGVKHYAHRLAVLYMRGDWPRDEVDHIDGFKGNNSWRNLREASRSLNAQNLRAQKRNSSGLLGVSRNHKGWQARIKVAGVERRLGTYEAPELAHAAYLAEKRRLHPGCTI